VRVVEIPKQFDVLWSRPKLKMCMVPVTMRFSGVGCWDKEGFAL
jgi:hypothetical protein